VKNSIIGRFVVFWAVGPDPRWLCIQHVTLAADTLLFVVGKPLFWPSLLACPCAFFVCLRALLGDPTVPLACLAACFAQPDGFCELFKSRLSPVLSLVSYIGNYYGVLCVLRCGSFLFYGLVLSFAYVVVLNLISCLVLISVCFGVVIQAERGERPCKFRMVQRG
jgi:hypothetical protein